MRIPLYILEEHNEAFYVWFRAIQCGIITGGSSLLHFDDHADFRSPVFDRSISEVMNGGTDCARAFVQRELHIDSFIVPAVYAGIIQEVVWIREGVQTAREGYRYVRTFNGAGKYFMVSEHATGAVDETRFLYRKTGPVLNELHPVYSTSPVLLDIDLDYFSCCENPYIENEIVIEITDAEYNEFTSNPYHYLHFITARAEAVKKNGACYYVLNNISERYKSRREVPEAEILNRIRNLVNLLNDASIKPEIITICRSGQSGFTPRHQLSFIQYHLLKALEQLYDFNTEQVFGDSIKTATVLA